ncbi:MAG TPA: zinc ABC transporter substrate-binding protein [Clostridiaceae bacterium]|nr:zinc ABC transporter substrate-binding protein [Clostridiaceae bacterium]
MMRTSDVTGRINQGRAIALLITFIIVVSFLLSACAAKAPEKGTDGRLDIVTTIFPPFDFVRAIGGQEVDVMMLLPPGSESHTYEPSPREVVRIAECDLFIYNGGISDAWVERLIEAAEIYRGKTVRMMDFVSLLEESHEGILEDDDDHHDHDHSDIPQLHAYDEHIWTSPKNALLIAEGITDRMAASDPGREALYRTNLATLKEGLLGIDGEFRKIVEEAQVREMIVADRFPLIYFTSEYGLAYTAAFPGCAAETDAKPKTVAGIISRVQEESIPYIFHIEFSDEKLADLIAEETGAGKLLFHTAHNVSKDELEAGATYLSIMHDNTLRLKRGLSR